MALPNTPSHMDVINAVRALESGSQTGGTGSGMVEIANITVNEETMDIDIPIPDLNGYDTIDVVMIPDPSGMGEGGARCVLTIGGDLEENYAYKFSGSYGSVITAFAPAIDLSYFETGPDVGTIRSLSLHPRYEFGYLLAESLLLSSYKWVQGINDWETLSWLHFPNEESPVEPGTFVSRLGSPHPIAEFITFSSVSDEYFPFGMRIIVSGIKKGVVG